MATVILATPDAFVYSSFSAEMEGEGYTVIWATDGKDAYDLTLEHSPALVLLDTSLPIFDGFETCRMIGEDPTVPRELPVYLLTDEDVNRHRVEKCGAAGVFPKTHQFHQIRELLAEVTAGS